MVRLTAGLFLAVLLTATPVAAQVGSVTHGFALGLHAQGAGLDPEDDLNDAGGGGGLDFAYGFRNGISPFLTFSVAAMQPEDGKIGSSYALTEVDLGARYHFGGEQNSWRPFVEAALTGMLATFEDVNFGGAIEDVEVKGPAFSAGGGIDYFISPSLSAGLGLRWSTGSFDEVTIRNFTVRLDPEDEFDVTTTRLQLGMRYHFAG
jgi:opacity protein-like surface antigen